MLFSRVAGIMVALSLSMSFALPAQADEPPAKPAPSTARRGGPSPAKVVGFVGVSAAVLGYSLDVFSVLYCDRDCGGAAQLKLAIPFVGHALYRADPDRRAAVAQSEARARELAARGDGCTNSALGCEFLRVQWLDDIIAVMAWVPTMLQIGGAALAVVGFSVSATERKQAKTGLTWVPQARAARGGGTVGLGGTF